MKNLKKLMVSMFIMILGLAGCSAGSGTDSSEPVTITFATSDTGDTLAWQQSMVDEYNASQESVIVELQGYGSAFDQKLTSSVGTSSAPDVVKMWNYSAYSPILLPLNDYVDKMDDKDDFYETLWNYSTVGDDIYGVPTGFTTRAIYANTELLNEVAPDFDPETWTIDDMTEYMSKVDEGKGFFDFYNSNSYGFESWLWTFGSEGWLTADGKSNLSDPTIEETLQYFHDLIYNENYMTVKNGENTSFDEEFVSNNYLFGQTGMWFMDSINEASNGNLSIVPIPAKAGDKGYSTVHASSLAITADSEYPDAAWDFIQWYTNKEGIKSATKFEMPVRKSVAEEEGYLEDAQMSVFYEMLESSTEYQSSLLKSEEWGKIELILNDLVENVYLQEDADIKGLLEDADKQIKELTGE